MAHDHPDPFTQRDETRPAIYELARQPGRGKPYYKLLKQFRYTEPHGAKRTFVVPLHTNDFVTDLASIPWFATWLVPRDGTHTPAALLHDALVRDRADNRSVEGDLVRDRHDADSVMRDAMGELGVPLIRRWMIWAAISVGSLAAGGKWKRLWYGFVIGITVVAALLMSLLMAGDVTHQDMGWRPDALDTAFLRHDLRWVVLATPLLWLRHIGAGCIAVASVLVFGVPMLVALLAFVVYFLADGAIGIVLKMLEASPLPMPAGHVNLPRVFGVDGNEIQQSGLRDD